MSTNLRLGPETAAALREAAQRSGRSQQELIRAAVDHALGLRTPGQPEERRDPREAPDETGVQPPRDVYAEADELIRLPRGLTVADLLDRSDRV